MEKTNTAFTRLLRHITVVTATPIVFFISIYLARIHPIFLALIPTILVYPPYLDLVREKRLLEASTLILEWALLMTVSMVYITTVSGEDIGSLVINGLSYKREMFLWVKTGYGPEGDPSLFMIPKIREIIIFSLAALATIGFLGLLMGAILLNYMNYYVGALLLHANPGALLTVALLSWPVYAILRVPGYVFLGTALTRISYAFIKERKLVLEPEAKRLLIYASVLIALDFVLKATVANTFYQPMLKQLTNI